MVILSFAKLKIFANNRSLCFNFSCWRIVSIVNTVHRNLNLVTSVGSLESSIPSSPPETVAPLASVNPFAADVCPGPLGGGKSVEALNEEVLEQLVESVETRSKAPLILLTAPRAGYGKTHLLGRVVSEAGRGTVMVPLAFRSGDALNLTTITRRGLEALMLAPGEKPGWTRLREVSAGVVMTLLHRLISEGQLPCANPEQALRVLEGPASDLFDPEGSARLIGDWLRKQSLGLRPVLARQAARLIPVRLEVVDAWLEALLEQASFGEAEGMVAMQDLATLDAESGTPAWLRLISLWRPPVLLVDHLDGYYRNPEAGIKIASLLMELVDAHGLHVLLSLNQDVWQATFGHHLPSALEDRLTASQVLLRGLREADAQALLKLRLAAVEETDAADFVRFVNVPQYFLGRPIGSVSARVFLRHCARQWEVFQNSSPEISELVESTSVPALPSHSGVVEEGNSIPLMTETLPLEATAEIPDIFDASTIAEVQQIAEGLVEPIAALPQDEAPLVSDWSSRAEPEEIVPVSTPAAPTVTPSADAFVKLRAMLHSLREPPVASASPTAPVTAEASVADRLSNVMSAGQPKPADALLGRFEALRLQMSAEAETQALDFTKLAELIRLAGRRFPLVRLSEHELPGMTGRHTMVWSLQGVELLFGLAPFTDAAYWRVLSGFAAGRLADLAAQAEKDGAPPARLKLVTFKSDREHAAWQALYASDTLPTPLKPHLDAVHLDSRSIASLYAMQRIIREAESGTLQAEPNQVMTALARELDFFWKRITRA